MSTSAWHSRCCGGTTSPRPHCTTNALKTIAAKAGHAEAFNLTVTLAFLALIGERMASQEAPDFEAFAARNPDLLEKGVLRRWYPAQRLSSTLARRTFLLPDPG